MRSIYDVRAGVCFRPKFLVNLIESVNKEKILIRLFQFMKQDLMPTTQWYFSQRKYRQQFQKNVFLLIWCMYLDCASNFKLLRPKNCSKISIFGRVMRMYISTGKLGHFCIFVAQIFLNSILARIAHQVTGYILVVE